MAHSAVSSRSTGAIVLARLAFVAWGLALIVFVNRAFEWTYPYCNIQDDGPSKPAYGFPLPYLQDSAAFSMSPDYMPHVLALNIVLLAALAYLVMGRTVRWLSAAGRIGGILIAVPGVLLAILFSAAFLGFELKEGYAVSSIAQWRDRYWDYRPLGIIFEREYYDCTPSQYWFGPIKNQSLAKVPKR
jgi:hypothetical protein